MKVLLVGMGSIGKRHARILLDRLGHELFAFRSSESRLNIPGIVEVCSWQEVDGSKPEVAFITNPTMLHIQTALNCAERGMHLFIEKQQCAWAIHWLDSKILFINNRGIHVFTVIKPMSTSFPQRSG